MPKRWRITTVVTLTELEAGTTDDTSEMDSREYKEEEEAKAKAKFGKVRDKAKQETDRPD